MSKSGAKEQHVRWQQHLLGYALFHLNAFKISFRNLSLTPLATLMTVGAIGLCLALPGALYLFIKNVQHISQGWDKGQAMTLYLKQATTDQQVQHIIQRVQSLRYVKSTTYLPPEKALQEFQAASGLQDMLALLPENPLPGVINLQVNTKMTTQEELNQLKDTLAKDPQVKQVDFDYGWVEKLNVFLSFGKVLAKCLYLMIGFGVILMVCNTIRLALEHHKEEIDVLNTIGATTAFIRRPYLYRGLLYGGVGGMIAILILNTMSHVLQNNARELASLYSGLFILENLRFYDTVILLIASAGLGWLGAVIAFAQQNQPIYTENH